MKNKVFLEKLSKNLKKNIDLQKAPANVSKEENIIEDTLSRRLFAERIANELAEIHLNPNKENIVFAISGKWGTGKTRILELIEEFLLEKQFSIVKFNPWKYSQGDITIKRAFLKKVKKYVPLPSFFFFFSLLHLGTNP